MRPPAYDSAGNLTSTAGSDSFTYDAEGQMTANSTTGYLYDGDGNRVAKTSSGTATVMYWYDLDGNALDETDGSGNLISEYAFLGGSRIGRRDASSGNVYYYFADHLGSPRSIVQAGQTSSCYDADFYPYGGERAYTTTCAATNKFTGYEYDSETGLDHAVARRFWLGKARFASPDLLGGSIDDPQSLNRYAYVGNDPLNRIDPSGNFFLFTFFKLLLGIGRNREGGGRGGISIGIGLGGGGGAFGGAVDVLLAKQKAKSAPPSRVGSDPWPDGTLAETDGIPDWLSFPNSPGFSGCTYGSGSCGGGVYGFTLGSLGGTSNPIWLDGFSINVLVLDYFTRPDLKSIKQRAKDIMNQHPLVKWYVCGENPRGALREYLIGGAIKGAVIGGVAGGVSGSAAGGIGAVPGAIVGAAGGAITGAAAGAVVAAFAIAACSALGAYN